LSSVGSGSVSHIALSPLDRVFKVELTDGFVKTEGDEENSTEDLHPVFGVSDAVGQDGSATDGNAGVEELGNDSTDDNRVEPIVGSKRNTGNLSLVTHLSDDKHDGEENEAAVTAPFSAAEELLDFDSTELVLLVSIVMMKFHAFNVFSHLFVLSRSGRGYLSSLWCFLFIFVVG